MLALRSLATVGDRQRLEEPLRASLHHREEDPLLGAEVVTRWSSAGDAGLVDEGRHARRLVALLRHQPLRSI